MEPRPVILIADDDERIRRSLTDILLTQRYKIIQAQNGAEALEKVKTESPDVILLDINMPEMTGIEVTERLKQDPESRLIPIVIVTGHDDTDLRVRALKLGADDFLTKPPHVAELTARVRSLLKVKAYNDHMQRYQSVLEEEVRMRTEELDEAHERLRNASLDTIYRLSRAAEYKDEDTSVHIQRMSHYAATLAERMGMSSVDTETLLYSAPMHDIGKLGIPDRILLKPGKLDSDEWKVMKQHTLFGEQILEDSDSDFIKLGKTIAVTHHEKWDGSGYPHGSEGEQIPIQGRIVAVADVFDALTSRRPYKDPFSNDRAFQIVEEGRGSHFDPDLVDAFLGAKSEILETQATYSNA